jgi:hypothetical protein
MAERIQLRRTRGWRKPEGAVVVARPTKWGNPFHIGMVVDRIAMTNRGGNTNVVEIRVETRAQATEFYRRWIHGTLLLKGGHDLASHPPTIAQIRADLAWRDLACWCPLDQPCHADVLLRLANQGANA